MTRKEGFIEVDKMLQEIGVDTTSLSSIKNNPQINIINNIFGNLHFSFNYKNETYFYKYSLLFDGSAINPYNELVVEELAKDFGIPCVDYDLATIGFNNGVLSKNFKKPNTNYIFGESILEKSIKYYDSNLDNDLIQESRYAKNTLDDIWDELEIRYQNYQNKSEIISHLMKHIVDIYLFDIIICQKDRHDENWQIMESDNSIDIAPLYDNERILVVSDENAIVNLGVDFLRRGENLWESIKKFQKVSNSEFINTIKDKL